MYAIVDIETTGTYASANGITEIAIVLHDGARTVDAFQSLVNPGTGLAPFISRLTGISNEMLRDAPKFHEIAKKVWEMTENAVFVAHSVNFDYAFIREEFRELGADFRRKKLCTVRLSRAVFPGHTSYSLANICARLGIGITGRHRAMGDASATVKLFEQCLQNDRDGSLGKLLKRNSKDAILPPNLSKEMYEALPEKTGVYYFHDSNGKIIYVGKAINIRKRIYSHLTGSGAGKISFTSAIAKITYELCGSELIALLLESDEIKRLFPIYNQAQKFDRGSYVLTEYTNQKGIRQMLFTKDHRNIRPLKIFRSFEAAREFMFALTEEFELCPKYCGIQSTPGACFDYQLKKCRGVCNDSESILKYNKRVEKALKSIRGDSETYLIVDEGRSFKEKSVVLVEDGVYKGFGYFENKETVTVDEAKEIIRPLKHTGDAMRILEGWNA